MIKKLADYGADELLAMMLDRFPSQDGDAGGALEFYLAALEDCDERALKLVLIGFFKGKFKQLSPTFRPTTAQIIFLHDEVIADYEEQLRRERLPPPQQFVVEGSVLYRQLCKHFGRSSFPSSERKSDKVKGWYFDEVEITKAQSIELEPMIGAGKIASMARLPKL